jgi:hypothetical protein
MKGFGLQASGFGFGFGFKSGFSRFVLEPGVWSLKPDQNPTNGLNQVVHDCVGDQPLGRAALFVGAVPGAHQHAARADVPRQRYVEPAIADREGLRRIDIELSDSTIHELAAWLAAIAVPGELRHGPIPMVRTIVIRVEVRASGSQQIGNMAMHCVDDRFGKKSARDARLIRDDHDADVGLVQGADRADGPWIQLHALRSIEVSDLLDERAIAIQEDSGLGLTRARGSP